MDESPLARIAEEPHRAAILLDVDGVLAPIVERPEDARVPDATRAELERLRRRYALVACVSGRASADAAATVGVEGLVYVGTHGLELEPEAAAWSRALREFAAGVPWPVEDKALSVSFHYRGDVDVAYAALVGLPAAVGAIGATAVQQRLRLRTIELMFAALIVAIAVWLFVK